MVEHDLWVSKSVHYKAVCTHTFAHHRKMEWKWLFIYRQIDNKMIEALPEWMEVYERGRENEEKMGKNRRRKKWTEYSNSISQHLAPGENRNPVNFQFLSKIEIWSIMVFWLQWLFTLVVIKYEQKPYHNYFSVQYTQSDVYYSHICTKRFFCNFAVPKVCSCSRSNCLTFELLWH